MTERGAAAPVLVAVVALIVMALGGVSSDLWRLLHAHRVLSGQVDAAAAVGAAALDEAAYRDDPAAPPRLDAIRARHLACSALRTHDGVDCPGPDVDIEVVDDSVTVTVRRGVGLLFVGRLLGSGSGEVPIEASTRVLLVPSAVP